MPDLLADNVKYLRGRVGSASISNSLLAELWQQVADGGGEVLRISPHRTVWKCQPPAAVDAAEHDAWLLKVYHPQRRAEALRRLFKAAPAMREEENWRLLAQRIGIQFALAAEQVCSDVGMLARPYWSGVRASDSLAKKKSVQAAKAMDRLASGLALLHRAHWTDSDLDANDLLFVDDFDGMLLPLDLGHAQVSLMKPPAEAVYADLQQLLASLPPEIAMQMAVVLLKEEHHGSWLKGYAPARLVERALQARTEHAWKRSRRCLRTVSDFDFDTGSSRRQGADALPDFANASPIKSGPRSTLYRAADTAWKFYPRDGVGQKLRKNLHMGPACLAFRRLYFLELLGFQVAPVQAWQSADGGEWLATQWLQGTEPSREQLPLVAAYLAKLHAFGITLRDAKPANFVLDGDQQLHLIDGDGIRPQLSNAWRDVARLIAEVEADSEMEAICLQRYADERNHIHSAPEAKIGVEELRRRSAKDAAYFRQLLQP